MTPTQPAPTGEQTAEPVTAGVAGGGQERSVNEGVERLQYLLQFSLVYRVLIAVERTDAQPEHRQHHGEAFPLRAPCPRQHWADARQVRSLAPYPASTIPARARYGRTE